MKTIQEEIFIYIGNKLKEQPRLNSKENERFLKYIGLDRENLKKLIQIEEPIEFLSEKNYGWKNLYGRNAKLEIQQYVQEKSLEIKNELLIKKSEVLNRFEKCLVTCFCESRDEGFAFQMLNCSSDEGLYNAILKEKHVEYKYLLDINKQTYNEILEEDKIAKMERVGFLGHRQEKVDDLFISVDSYLQQKYEIYRQQVINMIYDEILDKLKQYDQGFPNENLEEEVVQKFEQLAIYEIFKEKFLATLDERAFLTDVEKVIMIKNKEKMQLIIEGIQNNCIKITQKQVIIQKYDIIEYVEISELSLKELLEFYKKLQQILKTPKNNACYEITTGNIYESLINNSDFIKTLSNSLKIYYEQKKLLKQLESQF